MSGFKKIPILTTILLIAGSITWSLTMIKSGIEYSFGTGFWGPNGHDGIWHISLAESLSQGSWENPVFAGESIKNYHVGFDLLLAILHKVTFIPISTLYFQILPPLFALLIGYFVYKFVYEWTKSESKANWSLFFVYFSGSWGWLISYFRDGNFGGESMFWAQQSISTLINPPFALSLIILFAGLYFLVLDFHKKSTKHLMLVSLLFGVLVQVKVYAGILVLCGLFIAGFWKMLQRKGVSLVKVFTGSMIVSVLIFSPVTGDVGSAIEFRPFWFLETMMLFPDRVGWTRFGEAMVNYRSGGVLIKGIVAYFVALLVFWYGNLGTRIVKEPLVFKWFKNYKKLDSIQIFMIIVILAGIAIPLLFVQSGTPWNTIQFLYYALMFSGILAGISVGEFVESSKLNTTTIYIIVVTIILLTVPTSISTLYYHYLPSRPPAKISNQELEALNFLRDQPDGVVLTQPFDREKANEALSEPPRPLYAYESNAYVSAMTGKKTYMADEVNLEITGYDWRNRRESIEDFLENPNQEFLNENSIEYVYIVKDLGVVDPGISSIFENQEVIIYEN